MPEWASIELYERVGADVDIYGIRMSRKKGAAALNLEKKIHNGAPMFGAVYSLNGQANL